MPLGNVVIAQPGNKHDRELALGHRCLRRDVVKTESALLLCLVYCKNRNGTKHGFSQQRAPSQAGVVKHHFVQIPEGALRHDRLDARIDLRGLQRNCRSHRFSNA